MISASSGPSTADQIYAVADFITVHLPKNKETEGWLDAAAFAQMKDGVRILNVARGPLVVDADLQAALDSGKVAGAALDVFGTEPVTDHPLFGYPNVVVTPHLGASTAEATDRAGYQAAEQAIAALTGGGGDECGERAVDRCRRHGGGRSVPRIVRQPRPDRGRRSRRARRSTRSTSSSSAGSPNATLDCSPSRSSRACSPGIPRRRSTTSTRFTLAQERGIAITERSTPQAHDFTDLIRVRLRGGGETTRVVGTVLGRRNRPHLLEAWGSRFNVQLEEHLAVFRYRDQPGMLGRVGTALGDAGVNIISAAVGRRPEGDSDGEAVMVVTADAPVPAEVLAALLAGSDFFAARAVSL